VVVDCVVMWLIVWLMVLRFNSLVWLCGGCVVADCVVGTHDSFTCLIVW